MFKYLIISEMVHYSMCQCTLRLTQTACISMSSDLLKYLSTSPIRFTKGSSFSAFLLASKENKSHQYYSLHLLGQNLFLTLTPTDKGCKNENGRPAFPESVTFTLRVSWQKGKNVHPDQRSLIWV